MYIMYIAPYKFGEEAKNEKSKKDTAAAEIKSMRAT